MFENTDDSYGLIAKFFHWAIAVLILGLVPVGLTMTQMENSPLKFEIYSLHKSFGLLVFFLGLARLFWRFVSPAPDAHENHAGWERALAAGSHFWLYVCILGLPLTGWAMSSALEYPVPFFGLQMPAIAGKDEGLGAIAGQAHEILAYTLLFVLALHMAGALKHHVLDRDDTLQRMSFARAGIGFAAILVLTAGSVYAVSALLLWRDARPLQQTAREEAAEIPLPDTAALPENGWAIVKGESRLTFTTTMYETPFTGIFGDFDGTIIFNPDNLAESRADIRIGLDNIKTGDADRDANIIGPDWFDAAANPDARFETIRFEKGDGDNYIAIGHLTLRGVTLPISLPFTLRIEGDKASMEGRAVLNRLDFGLGAGEWEGPKTVGHEVEVIIAIAAIR